MKTRAVDVDCKDRRVKAMRENEIDVIDIKIRRRGVVFCEDREVCGRGHRHWNKERGKVVLLLGARVEGKGEEEGGGEELNIGQKKKGVQRDDGG